MFGQIDHEGVDGCPVVFIRCPGSEFRVLTYKRAACDFLKDKVGREDEMGMPSGRGSSQIEWCTGCRTGDIDALFDGSGIVEKNNPRGSFDDVEGFGFVVVAVWAHVDRLGLDDEHFVQGGLG